MTTPYIRPFSVINKKDTAIVGGKGANLGELTKAGFPVPPGFVITTQGYSEFFASLGLEKELDQLSRAEAKGLERYCALIREIITSTEFPALPSKAIFDAYDQLIQVRGSSIFCAVRSSATTEDLQDASFAGQHGTYYYVDRTNLLHMVRLCWASLWNAEAVSYRFAHGIEHAAAQMAVVVQEMIRADVSGITFTVNPVSQAEEIVIESSWGMGAALVDGRVTPDHYILDRNSLQLRDRRIACKRFMVSSSLQDSTESRLEEVPSEKQQQETLEPDQISKVAHWAIRAEKHFGSPQDLEWAITDNTFYLLQSRPITAMGGQKRTQDPAGKYVLGKPLAENLTEPLSPITLWIFSLAISPWARFIEGRVYLDLEFFLSHLPVKFSEQELATLLYDLSIETAVPLKRISWGKLPLYLALLLYVYLTFGLFLARTRKLPDNAMDHYRDLCRKVEDDPSCTPVEAWLRLFLPDLFTPIGKMPLIVNFSAGRSILLPGPLKQLLHFWLPDASSDIIPRLCAGQQGVLSAEMGREIQALAQEAGKCQVVRDMLLQCSLNQLLPRLRQLPDAKNFLCFFDQFLKKHGHRAVREIELQSPRWEEEPSQVLGMVRNYLLADTKQKQSAQHSGHSRNELEAELRRQLEQLPFERFFRPRWRLLRFLLNETRYLVKLRENSRFYYMIGLYSVRKKLLGIERNLLGQGELKCKDDIFFLYPEEIDKMQQGQLGWRDIEERLRQRRLEHVRFSRKVPRKTVGIDLPEHRQRPEHGDSTVLPGQSASPGSYKGIARVILDPAVDAELQPGEILVAPYTDPAWTPLFLTAGAAAVEVGSYLSHAGTVAREYGLPCVVDVAGCTERIQTGNLIFVDGNQGVVHLLANEGNQANPECIKKS
ncbi:PEP/pyruvate-binding domain-containing protein [Candidatus Electrothrix sp.]|uniref:PEP/pyruvate-binding domain-containing protein n=1 Tax=Candidatus Electrothrix sp. TaxID=2170559 RepID=UPI0040565E16